MEEQAQQAQNINESTQGANGAPSSNGLWKRMRAPGMTLTYSMEKRHVPDVDAEKTASGGAQKNVGSNGGGQSKQANTGSGTSDVMQCNGSCTVRYFDLAVGAVAMLVLCGVLKCCCECCRTMRYKIF